MSILIPRRRWHNKPPPNAQINWGHPTANGLVLAYLMNDGGGQQITDYVRKANAALSGNAGWTRNPNTAVNFVEGAGGSSYANAAVGSFQDPGNGSVSIAIGMINRQTDASQGYILQTGPNPNNPMAIVYIGTAGFIQSRFENSTTNLGALTSGFDAGIYYDWVFTLDRGATTTAAIYRNAVQITSNSGTVGDMTGAANLHLGSDISGNNTWAGDIFYVYLFKRSLAPSEIMQLHVDPYCFIQHRPTFWASSSVLAANKQTLAMLGVGG